MLGGRPAAEASPREVLTVHFSPHFDNSGNDLKSEVWELVPVLLLTGCVVSGSNFSWLCFIHLLKEGLLSNGCPEHRSTWLNPLQRKGLSSLKTEV